MNESRPTSGWNDAAPKPKPSTNAARPNPAPSPRSYATCRHWKRLPGTHIGACEWKPPGPLPAWLRTVGDTCLASDGRECQAWQAIQEPEAVVIAPTKPADATSVYSDVDHPRHYNAHPSGVECIVVVEHFGYNLGNVIKYLWRAEEKGAPLKDLQKAAWYLRREIERREGGQPAATHPS